VALASQRFPSIRNVTTMPTKLERIGLDEVLSFFEPLEDPRSTINRRHPLTSVIVIALMAVLAGAGGPTAIARWAHLKSEFLLKLLPLPDGIPCKDVFRRVLFALHPRAFQDCFVTWLQWLRAKAADATGIEQPVLAIDGKTLRRSHDRRSGLGAMHSVSVWASEYGLSLGQVPCGDKSNEITAIPELLRLVDIRGAIITIDAMGTQKAIAEQIIDGEGDYVLALKGNQEKLYEAVADHIAEHSKDDFARVDARVEVTEETGHGRREQRTYVQMPVPEGLATKELWKGLCTIGLVVSVCIRNGIESMEMRYYISSLALGVKRFAHAVRSHWGIENSCHWSLDITYREDESRIRDEHMRENFAWLNRLTLSLLKQHPGKGSIAMKRRSCGWDENFMLEVLTGTRV
jgi:predicted transposase YbfD/YdcC